MINIELNQEEKLRLVLAIILVFGLYCALVISEKWNVGKYWQWVSIDVSKIDPFIKWAILLCFVLGVSFKQLMFLNIIGAGLIIYFLILYNSGE